MSNELLSIGDLIDKLIIENIKIFNLREKLHGSQDSEEKVKLSLKMMILNENRSILSKAVDEKIENVINGGEENKLLKIFKTYKSDRND